MSMVSEVIVRQVYERCERGISDENRVYERGERREGKE
jgi:hypothetical protein